MWRHIEFNTISKGIFDRERPSREGASTHIKNTKKFCPQYSKITMEYALGNMFGGVTLIQQLDCGTHCHGVTYTSNQFNYDHSNCYLGQNYNCQK